MRGFVCSKSDEIASVKDQLRWLTEVGEGNSLSSVTLRIVKQIYNAECTMSPPDLKGERVA